MNQVEVKILQQSYLLACKEGQENRLTEAVGLVDGAMTRIHDAGKVRARERIAVLAALNLAYELGDLRLAHQQLLNQIPEPVAQAQASAASNPALSLDDAAAYQAQTTALQALVIRLEELLNTPVAATQVEPAQELGDTPSDDSLGADTAENEWSAANSLKEPTPEQQADPS